MRQPKLIDYILLTVLALIWSSAFFNIKIATYSFGPVTIAFLRVFFGAFPVLFLCYVKKITGYTIGVVSPVGHLNKVKIYIDNNLERFTTIFAAAGHPNCVFKIGFTQLTKLTTGEKKEITE